MGFVTLAGGSVKILGLDVPQALKLNKVAYVPQNEEIDWNFPVLVRDVVMMGRYGRIYPSSPHLLLRLGNSNLSPHFEERMRLYLVSMPEEHQVLESLQNLLPE